MSHCTPDPLVLQANLTAAKQAYHQLVTGQMARVIVDRNGERVEFTATNRTTLANYIAELETALGCRPLYLSSGPAQFIF